MAGIAQIGLAVGALGVVLAFMGLFPGVTGVRPAEGMGLVQFATLWVGFMLLHLGALIYVKFTFYAGRDSNLAQQVGIRLTLTGLVFMGIAGLADFLGFGSHIRTATLDSVFGQWQAFGVVSSLLLTAMGVFIYALAGAPPPQMASAMVDEP